MLFSLVLLCSLLLLLLSLLQHMQLRNKFNSLRSVSTSGETWYRSKTSSGFYQYFIGSCLCVFLSPVTNKVTKRKVYALLRFCQVTGTFRGQLLLFPVAQAPDLEGHNVGAHVCVCVLHVTERAAV